MVDDAPPPLWERQPGESGVAWSAFLLYRDATGKRRTSDVAQQSRKDASLIRRWSARWAWQDRVAAWDIEEDRLWRLEVARSRRAVARRHAETALQMQGKGLAKLASIPVHELSERAALRLIELGMAAEAEMFGTAAATEDGASGTRIIIDSRLLPPMPEEDR